jgi:hypothetical protein
MAKQPTRDAVLTPADLVIALEAELVIELEGVRHRTRGDTHITEHHNNNLPPIPDVRRPEPDGSRIEEYGRRWIATHADIVASLPRGTMIAVNIDTGAFVTAPTGVEVMDKFEATFGKLAWAWVDEIGVPIRLGGGLWGLSSGA